MEIEESLYDIDKIGYFAENFDVQVLDTQKVLAIHKQAMSENTKTELSNVSWKAETGELFYKGKEHSFQSRDGKNPLLVLFDILWNTRKEIGKRERGGKTLSRSDIGFEIAKRRKIDPKLAIKELPAKIKSINRILGDKDIQIEITGGEEDTQMIVTL